MNPNIVQTFYVSSSSVGGSPDYLLSSVDIFFRSKPSITKNTSGSSNPGVSVYLCEVTNEVPNTAAVLTDIVRRDYSQIYAFSDASVSTKFTFGDPIPLKSNRFYGICIILEDPQYLVWKNVQEQFLLATAGKSTGSSTLSNGRFYENADKNNNLKYLSDTNITFKVNIAKFAANNAVYELVNEDYEFLTIANRSGNYKIGEQVWKIGANSAGTVSVTSQSNTIVGTGTNFTSLLRDGYIAITDGSQQQVMKIDYIANNTYMTSAETSIFSAAAGGWYPTVVGEVFDYRPLSDSLFLTNSSANSTLKFTNAASIRGEISGATSTVQSVDITTLDGMTVGLSVVGTKSSNVALAVSLASANSSNVYSSSNTSFVNIPIGQLYTPTKPGFVLSRSLEVDSPYLLNGKSTNFKVTIDLKEAATDVFFFPVVDITTTNVFVGTSKIINSTVAGGIDTEIYNAGLSPNRYISKKTSFANNRYAEDLKLYLNAYRPAGSTVQVYAKVHNSRDFEAFEDKIWTPLVITDNKDRYSSSKSDVIEYTYSIPNYPEVAAKLTGKFTSTSGNNVITASSGNPSSIVSAGDLIRVYDPIFSTTNYSMHSVASANSTAIVLDSVPSQIQTGLIVEKCKYPAAAFTNIGNNYIVRYYTEGTAYVDTFDTMQIKIVLTASSARLSPEVDSIQVIGVSA